MALQKDVYRELEDILGPENISEDLAVLDGYAYQNNFARYSTAPEYRYLIRPEAVVLPGSTEDVQAVIKLCNRRGIKSKAFCTGFGPHNAAGSEGVIILDLRRMNRILDFDEKNMTIVVEPYVSFAQVQGEAMKRGLNIHVIAAGSQTSCLASHTSMHGNNYFAISHGHSARNMLGAEWVTPTGEIVRFGSLGAGAGWFSGDGPGPSLRGIIRGAGGALGGLGVFTKCACHLHPWPGPKEITVKGISPEYDTELPPFFEYYICDFPEWEQFTDAVYKIGEAGIGYALHKTGGPGSHGAYVTTSNDQYVEKRQAGELDIPHRSFSIILACNSSEEHAYQVKVLNRILEENNGTIAPVSEDPLFKERDFLHMIRMCHIPRFCFRLTGAFTLNGILAMDTMANVGLGLEIDEALRDKYEEKGLLLKDGTNNAWAAPFEGSHLALAECGHAVGAFDEETCRRVPEMEREGIGIALKTPLALSWTMMGQEGASKLGPICGNPQIWMRKIKKVFDPNTASDPVGYISADSKDSSSETTSFEGVTPGGGTGQRTVTDKK